MHDIAGADPAELDGFTFLGVDERRGGGAEQVELIRGWVPFEVVQFEEITFLKHDFRFEPFLDASQSAGFRIVDIIDRPGLGVGGVAELEAHAVGGAIEEAIGFANFAGHAVEGVTAEAIEVHVIDHGRVASGREEHDAEDSDHEHAANADGDEQFHEREGVCGPSAC
ncbi:MAG: hypothetical protein RI897_3136 [Verrucomicrobiota bacterium]